jgi:hypothetical protein
VLVDKVWVPGSAGKHENVVVQEHRFKKDLVCQKDLLGFVDPGLGPFGNPDCTDLATCVCAHMSLRVRD